MTHYAFDAARSELLAVYTCPVGFRAEIIVATGMVSAESFLKVSHLLSQVSSLLWQAYERLPSAQVAAVVAALPQLAALVPSGMDISGFQAVDAATAQLAEVLERCGVSALSVAVRDQIRADLHSIDHALSGDFTGRAVQAAALDRRAVITAQVDAADRILRDDPLALGLADAGVDAASACVAVTQWLLAAATVAARAADVAVADVFAVADQIRPLRSRVPELVIARVVGGAAAADVVVRLLHADLAEAPELAEVGRSRHVLELLLRGLAACAVVYFHHVEPVRDADDPDAERDRILDEFRSAVRGEKDRSTVAG